MATKTKTVIEEHTNGSEEENRFLKLTHDLLLASIGALAMAQDEIEEFIDKLIERGEIAEKDGKKMVREVMDRRKKDAENAEDEFNKRIEDIMSRMNVPTKADIEALSEKITTLAKKVDDLKKA